MANGKLAARQAQNGDGLGFEEKLWAAADKMRGHMDPSEYKHVLLGLIFLKYISDAFTERHDQLKSLAENPASEYYVREERARYEVLEDRDEYLAENIFWVPQEARWPALQAQAKQPTIGKLIDDAMVAIERENPALILQRHLVGTRRRLPPAGPARVPARCGARCRPCANADSGCRRCARGRSGRAGPARSSRSVPPRASPPPSADDRGWGARVGAAAVAGAGAAAAIGRPSTRGSRPAVPG